MATGPVGDDCAALRAQVDALAARLSLAEAEVARLSAALGDARAVAPPLTPGDELGLFGPDDDGPLADGADRQLLSKVLTVTAVVAGLVALLAVRTGTLFSAFGVLMVVLTVGLAWAAVRTRVVPVEVSVTRGIVYVTRGDSTHRFDVRESASSVQMVGRPGDPGWQLQFPRRGLDPFVIDASMVDADDFVRRLREWRPEL
ncbi:hypothetical protein [Nocardioides sp. YIM 152588]|uniref:hypothetical protein n=1 Tax=Nocardioides sp. YIM 152588 TaxID=3158259 RepID=UPI0032E4451D